MGATVYVLCQSLFSGITTKSSAEVFRPKIKKCVFQAQFFTTDPEVFLFFFVFLFVCLFVFVFVCFLLLLFFFFFFFFLVFLYFLEEGGGGGGKISLFGRIFFLLTSYKDF